MSLTTYKFFPRVLWLFTSVYVLRFPSGTNLAFGTQLLKVLLRDLCL